MRIFFFFFCMLFWLCFLFLFRTLMALSVNGQCSSSTWLLTVSQLPLVGWVKLWTRFLSSYQAFSMQYIQNLYRLLMMLMDFMRQIEKETECGPVDVSNWTVHCTRMHYDVGAFRLSLLVINVSLDSWVTAAISKSACADEIHPSFDPPFPPTAHNHFFS